MKKITVIGSPEFVLFFQSLSDNGSFKQELNSAIDVLEENYCGGQKIEKTKWPNYYRKKYQIGNLWRYMLRGRKRLMYTISYSTDDIMISILEVFSNHAEYDKRMGY